MATFVSLATCHYCPITSTRHGLVYRDSLSLVSRSLRAPRSPRVRPGPRFQDMQSSRLTRSDLPELVLVSNFKRSSNLKHLVLAHLRRLLSPSPTHGRRRGLHVPG